MNGGRRKTFPVFILIIITVILIITFTCCSEPDEPGYMVQMDQYGNLISSDDASYQVSFNEEGNRIITIKEGIGYFSMLYPSDYTLGLIKIDQSCVALDMDNLTVDFLGQISPNGMRSWINIDICDYQGELTAEYVANDRTWERNLENFELIDESCITVAGVTAYQFSFYFDDFPYDPHRLPEFAMKGEIPKVTFIWREIDFDHSGFLWTLHLSTTPFREERDMAIFDKILESFTILD